MSRRHRLHTEASYRSSAGSTASCRARHRARGRAAREPRRGDDRAGLTQAEAPVAPVTIELSADYPDRVAGVVYGLDTVVARLEEVGCAVRSTPASHEPTIARGGRSRPERRPHAKHDRQHTVLLVTPPSWRPT